MNMRRLVALVHGLGPTARSRTHVTGGWGEQEHLLADIGDRVELLRHTVKAAAPFVVFSKQEPHFIKRPLQETPTTVRMAPGDFFAHLKGDAHG